MQSHQVMHVKLPGLKLFVRTDGAEKKKAPWLVLSNSLAADHTMWDAQVQLLTRRFRVLRYDTRGHGQSDVPSGPYSFELLVDDVIGLLDQMKIERAHFMGLSLGGMTGIGLALKVPERLEALVVCDARADAPEPFVKGWEERIAAIERDGMKSIVAGTIERWLVPQFRATHPDIVQRVERMIAETPAAGYVGCAHALKRLDYLRNMQRITAPSLFVVGREDAGAPPPVMQQMAARVPKALFEIVENAAHLPNIDNERGFEAAISHFLGLS
jgi:3-oxoadipate enol-lactonase